MEQPGGEPPTQRRLQPGRIDPRDVEPVGDECVVLGSQLGLFRRVDREAEAADHTERVAGELAHPLERSLCQLPVFARLFRAELTPRDVVAHCAAAQREAAVSAAGTARDLAGLVEPDPQTCGREREGARAAGDAAADDLDLGRARPGGPRQRLERFLEPVRRHGAIVVTGPSSGRRPRTR
jgi:hypothetical protein